MAIFGKNQSTQSTEVSVNVKPQKEPTKQVDLRQIETKIHQLTEKVNLEKEKNSHLIETQKGQLEQLRKELQTVDSSRGAAMGYLNGGGTKDPETLKETAKRAEALSEQATDLKRNIDRIELDILLLEQEKDTESINEILNQWDSYEKEVFQNYISPIHQEVVAAKALYFEKLKQLRKGYTDVERLAVHINSSLGDADKVTVHTWFNATLNNPELLLTKYDEEKEEAITHSYLAE